MKTEFDPIVAEALAQIAPRVEADPDEVLRRAAADARRELAPTPLARVAVIAFAGAALLAGAAYAATQLDLVPWLRTKDHSSVRFSVDPKKHFSGSVPQALRCVDASETQAFTCRPAARTLPGPAGERHLYALAERIEAQPTLTRDFILRQVDGAERNGTVRPLMADRIRADARAVPDDFFTKMNVLVSVRSIGTGPVVVEREGQPPVTLVPPRHVPVLVTCTERVSAGWLCRDLAAAQGVPIAAPVYELQAGSDWRRVARPPRIEIPAPPGLLERVFGRPLEPVERRLIFELVSTAANAPGEVHSHVSPPQAVAPPAERPRSR